MSEGVKVAYKCGSCGSIIYKEDLDLLPGIRCPYCGSKILFKVRPPRVKRVKAI